MLGFSPNSLRQAKLRRPPEHLKQIVGKVVVVVVVVLRVETRVGIAVGIAVGMVRRVVHGYCRAVQVGVPQRRLMDESVSGFPACRPPLFPRHGPRALFVAVLSRDVKEEREGLGSLLTSEVSCPSPLSIGAFAENKGGEGKGWSRAFLPWPVKCPSPRAANPTVRY